MHFYGEILMNQNNEMAKNMANLLERAKEVQLRTDLAKQIIIMKNKNGLENFNVSLAIFSIMQLKNIAVALRDPICVDAIRDERVTIDDIAKMDFNDLQEAIDKQIFSPVSGVSRYFI